MAAVDVGFNSKDLKDSKDSKDLQDSQSAIDANKEQDSAPFILRGHSPPNSNYTRRVPRRAPKLGVVSTDSGETGDKDKILISAYSQSFVGSESTPAAASSGDASDLENDKYKPIPEEKWEEELKRILDFFSEEKDKALLKRIYEGNELAKDAEALVDLILSCSNPVSNKERSEFNQKTSKDYFDEKLTEFTRLLNAQRAKLEAEIFHELNQRLLSENDKKLICCRNPKIIRFLALNNMIVFTAFAGVASFGIANQALSPWPATQRELRGDFLMISLGPALIGTILSGLILESIPKGDTRLQERLQFESEIKKHILEGRQVYDLSFQREITFFDDFHLCKLPDMTCCEGNILKRILFCKRPARTRCYGNTLKRILFSFVEAFGGFFRFLVKCGLSIYCIPALEHWVLNEEGEEECTTQPTKDLSANTYFLVVFIVPSAAVSLFYFAFKSYSSLEEKIKWALKQKHKSGFWKSLVTSIDVGLKALLYMGIVDSVEGILGINPQFIPGLPYGGSLLISIPMGIGLTAAELNAIRRRQNCSCGCCLSCKTHCGLEPAEVFETTLFSGLTLVLLYTLEVALQQLYEEGNYFAFDFSLIGYLMFLVTGMIAMGYFAQDSMEDEEITVERNRIAHWIEDETTTIKDDLRTTLQPLIAAKMSRTETSISESQKTSHDNVGVDSKESEDREYALVDDARTAWKQKMKVELRFNMIETLRIEQEAKKQAEQAAEMRFSQNMQEFSLLTPLRSSPATGRASAARSQEPNIRQGRVRTSSEPKLAIVLHPAVVKKGLTKPPKDPYGRNAPLFFSSDGENLSGSGKHALSASSPSNKKSKVEAQASTIQPSQAARDLQNDLLLSNRSTDSRIGLASFFCCEC